LCLIFFAFKAHPIYDLILFANRDEYYERQTEPARFWDDFPDLLAGRDIKGGGTWIGVTRAGKFAAITNFRDPSSRSDHAPSRGELVTDYLLGDDGADLYMENLVKKAENYNGFNLLAGDRNRICYYSNYGGDVEILSPGIYGLSNHLLNTSWPKVDKGNEYMKQIISGENDISKEEVFLMLRDSSIPGDEKLPDTGVGIEWERILSPVFVSNPVYGTRCSTILLIDKTGRVSFTERSYDSGQNITNDVSYVFNPA
jgi:uncharacterized protein with NRDE domain